MPVRIIERAPRPPIDVDGRDADLGLDLIKRLGDEAVMLTGQGEEGNQAINEAWTLGSGGRAFNSV